VKRGHVHGATGECDSYVAQNLPHVHDFHARILYLSNWIIPTLTIRHVGRDFRLTDIKGQIVQAILG
jgi:hypothetical protein